MRNPIKRNVIKSSLFVFALIAAVMSLCVNGALCAKTAKTASPKAAASTAPKVMDTIEKKKTSNGVEYRLTRRIGNRRFTMPPTSMVAGDNGSVWVSYYDTVARLAPDGTAKLNRIPLSICPGHDTVALRVDGRTVWARRAAGDFCALDAASGNWVRRAGPLVATGTAFIPAPTGVIVSTQGLNDNQGIGVFDRALARRSEFHRTKKIYSLVERSGEFIAGADQGLLRINRKTGGQTYTMPWEYKGGPIIRDIAFAGGSLVLATSGGYVGRAGDRMEIKKNKLRVYVKDRGLWYEYDWTNGASFQEDITNGALPYVVERRPGGVSALLNGRWVSPKVCRPKKPCNVYRMAPLPNGKLLIAGTEGLGTLDAKTLRYAPFVSEAANRTLGVCSNAAVSGETVWSGCGDAVVAIPLGAAKKMSATETKSKLKASK